MAVLPAVDITLPRARAGGGASLSCPALAGEERQALSFSRKARAHAEQRTPRKTSLQARREAERREAHQPEPHRQAMRRAPSLLSSHCGRTEAALDLKKWSGRARLSAPHRGIRGLLGLGSAQAALPGTTGCKREDPLRHQCSEHLAVRSRAGRDDAQTARKRGHEPRLREPHSLRQSAVTG